LAVLFGKKVKQLRKARGLSQEALAEMCGFHRNYPGRIERAELDFSFSYAMRLAMGLKVRPSELFRLIPVPKPGDLPDAQPKKSKKEK
jgi:transcriptional regulator with XRE-family HTH domain